MSPTPHYRSVHKWLWSHYGKADRCENDLSHLSVKFDWSKIKGKRCSYKRENYRMLCKRCHNIYDKLYRFGFKKGHKTNIGRKHTQAAIFKMSLSALGNQAMLGHHHSEKSKQQIRLSNLGQTRNKTVGIKVSLALKKYFKTHSVWNKKSCV